MATPRVQGSRYRGNKVMFHFDDVVQIAPKGFKPIIVKTKITNKHTQRTQKFSWFGNLPTSTGGNKKKVSL